MYPIRGKRPLGVLNSHLLRSSIHLYLCCHPSVVLMHEAINVVDVFKQILRRSKWRRGANFRRAAAQSNMPGKIRRRPRPNEMMTDAGDKFCGSTRWTEMMAWWMSKEQSAVQKAVLFISGSQLRKFWGWRMSAEDTRKSFNSRRPGDRCEPGDTEVKRSFWRARLKCLYLLRNHRPVGRVGLQPGCSR